MTASKNRKTIEPKRSDQSQKTGGVKVKGKEKEGGVGDRSSRAVGSSESLASPWTQKSH